jgi:hypothetical protein
VAPVLGSVLIPLRRRQSRDFRDFSRDSGLYRNSGESPEYPGFTDKIVLSGDFQDSPVHPPLGDIKILSQCLLFFRVPTHGKPSPPPRRQLRLSPSSVSVAYFFAVRHEKMHDKWDCRAPRQKSF